MTDPIETRRDGAAGASSRRFVFWLLLIASWIALLPFLWSAFSTVPSAERLAQSHTVEIPTLGTLARVVLVSALELGVALAAAWPRARLYVARLAAGALVLATWFIASAPLGITRLEWTHRRWLALVIVGLAGAAVVVGVRDAVRRRG
ncbi:MAG TPA: hypothetical protein VF039_07935 [Longimicrobiales bacterium]